MRGWLVLLAVALLLSLAQGHIYSEVPRVTYNHDGHPSYYSLYMSLENGMGASDFLRLTWPEQIHTTLKTEVTVILIVFSNNLEVATATCEN